MMTSHPMITLMILNMKAVMNPMIRQAIQDMAMSSKTYRS